MRKMSILNSDECRLSCWSSPLSSLSYCTLKPAAHDLEFDNCLWYIMELKDHMPHMIGQDIGVLCLQLLDGSVWHNIPDETTKS